MMMVMPLADAHPTIIAVVISWFAALLALAAHMKSSSISAMLLSLERIARLETMFSDFMMPEYVFSSA